LSIHGYGDHLAVAHVGQVGAADHGGLDAGLVQRIAKSAWLSAVGCQRVCALDKNDLGMDHFSAAG